MRTYSVLIIEDEWLERGALAMLTAALCPEARPIYTAGDSDEAMELARALQPDILLVDINIPSISGLALIRRLTEAGFGGRAVITTAHDRFAYVKEAMEMGCVGYLLKPVEERELSRMLAKCFASLDMERDARARDLRFESVRLYTQSYLAQDILEGDRRQNVLMSGFGWPADGKLTAFFGCYSASRPLTAREADTARDLLDWYLSKAFHAVTSVVDHRVLVLLQAKGPQGAESEDDRRATALWCLLTVAMRSIDEALDVSGIFRLSGPCKSYDALQAAYRGLSSLPPLTLRAQDGGKSPYLRYGQICGREPPRQKERRMLRQRMVQRLRERRVDRALAMVKRLCAPAGGAEASGGAMGGPWHAAQLLLEALLLLDGHIAVDEALSLLTPEGEPTEGLRPWLMEAVSARGVEAETAKTPEDSVETALWLLERRCHEPLSQAQVAEELGLSQAYFSRLFKQKTGQNFVAALRAVRVERAKRLLGSGVESLDAIAQRCGFSSTKYFCITFRKETGMDPGAYGKQAGQCG